MSNLGNKEIMAQNIKRLMAEHNIDRNTLCEKLGFKYSTLAEWLNAKAYPRIDKIQQMADFFKVDKATLVEAYIADKDKDFADEVAKEFLEILHSDEYNVSTEELIKQYSNLTPIRTKRIPMLGDIACGEPIFTDEDRESYVEVGTDIKADFCLRAKGDSMIGARILDGDIVFIRRQSIVDNGDIAAVVINEEATLKRVNYNQEHNTLILLAENPAFPPMVYQNEELESIYILGKAIALQTDIH